MKCPYCSQENTRVIDSRPAEDNSSIRRRRLCDSCGKRFTTYEKIETIPLIIIKKDNNGSVLYQLPSDKNYYEFTTRCSAQSVKFAADNFAKNDGITVRFEKKTYYSFKFTYKL